MKQQVDHPLSPCRARQQARDGGAYAAQGCLGREKRGEEIGVHGLTGFLGRGYMTPRQ